MESIMKQGVHIEALKHKLCEQDNKLYDICKTMKKVKIATTNILLINSIKTHIHCINLLYSEASVKHKQVVFAMQSSINNHELIENNPNKYEVSHELIYSSNTFNTKKKLLPYYPILLYVVQLHN